MKKISKQQLEKIIKMEYDTSMYFLTINQFLSKFSVEDFKDILNQEVFCRGLKNRLELMLMDFETIEAFEYCKVIKDYLDSNIDTYLY